MTHTPAFPRGRLTPARSSGARSTSTGRGPATLLCAAVILLRDPVPARCAVAPRAACSSSAGSRPSFQHRHQGMVVNLVRDVQDGRRDHSMVELFSAVAPVALPLIGLAIVAGIAIAIRFVLLVIPGLILRTIGARAPSHEHPGVFPALGRSRELVRGYGWQVFGTILLVALIEIAVYIVFGLIGIAFSDAVRAVLNWIAATLTAPIVALTSSVLYFALLAAKEQVAPAAAPPGRPRRRPPAVRRRAQRHPTVSLRRRGPRAARRGSDRRRRRAVAARRPRREDGAHHDPRGQQPHVGVRAERRLETAELERGHEQQRPREPRTRPSATRKTRSEEVDADPHAGQPRRDVRRRSTSRSSSSRADRRRWRARSSPSATCCRRSRC